MRYLLTDHEADPALLLRPATALDRCADVIGHEAGGPAAVLHDFVTAFRPAQLPRLQELTARNVGFGVETASSMFDDDLDSENEPFEGVLIVAPFRGDEVVVSRAAYKRFVAAMLEQATR